MSQTDYAPARIDEQAGHESTSSRRMTLSKLGVGLVAAVAATFAKATPASADGICNYYGCCCLKFPAGGCPGSGPSHGCPPLRYKRAWTCCQGTTLYYCSECTTGSSCWSPTWACSEYWTYSGFCGS